MSSPNVATMVKSSRDLDHDETISSIIQRSVSEKSRERSAIGHPRHPPYQHLPYCETHARGVQIPPLRHQKSAMSHVHSTPNVAAIRGGYGRRGTLGSDRNTSSGSIPQAGAAGMCSAVSEGELLDLAILPIFQKLLSERHKSRSGYGASIASCPNISIKCDIVEYL